MLLVLLHSFIIVKTQSSVRCHFRFFYHVVFQDVQSLCNFVMICLYLHVVLLILYWSDRHSSISFNTPKTKIYFGIQISFFISFFFHFRKMAIPLGDDSEQKQTEQKPEPFKGPMDENDNSNRLARNAAYGNIVIFNNDAVTSNDAVTVDITENATVPSIHQTSTVTFASRDCWTTSDCVKLQYRQFCNAGRTTLTSLASLACLVGQRLLSTRKLLYAILSVVLWAYSKLGETVKLKYTASESGFGENIRLSVLSFFSKKQSKNSNNDFLSTISDLYRDFRASISWPTFLTVCPVHNLIDYYREIESNPNMPEAERMKYDLIRTSSFSKFPRTCPVSAITLGKAGFYYKGNGDEVICYKCGIKYRNWQPLDDPFTIHKRISPNCPFISNLEGGHNRTYTEQETVLYSRERDGRQSVQTVTESNEIASTSSNISERNYGNPQSDNIPSSANNNRSQISVESNCSSTNSRSMVSNANNNVEEARNRRETSPSSNPLTGHNRSEASPNSSNQSTSTANQSGHNASLPTNGPGPSGNSVATTLEPLGISVQKPKYPQYAVLATRLSSFRNWPKELGQKLEDLAKAGFVYEGIVYM